MDLITRDEFEDLLGAFALDACDSNELAAVECYIAAHPEVSGEVERLRAAAAGLAASDALAPPRDVRASVFERARARRAPRTQTPVEVHTEVESALVELLDDVPESALDLPTFNGLTVRELVAHLAAMESVLAMWMGVPTIPEVEEERIEERTAAVVEMTRGWAFADVIALWRRSMAAVRAAAPDAATSRWFSSVMPTDLVLLVRAFETWTHTDDIRRSLDRALDMPSASALRTMAEGSMTMVPSALHKSGLSRPGRTARIVLTGPGGGDWNVPMEVGAEVGEPDVTLTLPIVHWCRL
ncbi:MAG: hypothetical protein QOF28_1990, partial [Actinomycetota bacterium]|nr:hypothetical protein [Actinomycetota bacterium]